MRVSGSRRWWRFPRETRCWLRAPQTEVKAYQYKGERRSKQVVIAPDIAPDTAPCRVAAVAANLPASRWQRRTVSEGTKGPIEYEFARTHVTLCKDGLPDRTVWLVIRRTGRWPSHRIPTS